MLYFLAQRASLLTHALTRTPPITGAGVGLVFGGVFAGLGTGAYDPDMVDKPLRKQIVESFRGVARTSVAMSKNFAVVGAVFALTECAIEQVCGLLLSLLLSLLLLLPLVVVLFFVIIAPRLLFVRLQLSPVFIVIAMLNNTAIGSSQK